MKRIFLNLSVVIIILAQTSSSFSSPVLTPPPQTTIATAQEITALVEEQIAQIFAETPPDEKPFLILAGLAGGPGFAAGAGAGYLYRVIQDQRTENHRVEFIKKLNDPHLIAVTNQMCKMRSYPCVVLIPGVKAQAPKMGEVESQERKNELQAQYERYSKEAYEDLKSKGLVDEDFETWKTKSFLDTIFDLLNSFHDSMEIHMRKVRELLHIAQTDYETRIASRLVRDANLWVNHSRPYVLDLYSYIRLLPFDSVYEKKPDRNILSEIANKTDSILSGLDGPTIGDRFEYDTDLRGLLVDPEGFSRPFLNKLSQLSKDFDKLHDAAVRLKSISKTMEEQ